MARKKIEPIKTLGKEDKLLVQKSRPLYALWRSDLTLAEFKILDTYLARINSHNPDKRVVMFEKGELEKILGVQKINNKDLKERLKHLMGNVVEVPDSSTKKGFRLVTLFEEAVAEQDDYGLWQVKLECTQRAMKYFFNIENLGYLRYKLRCITSITSRYTYIMFIYLESNRYRKSWEVPLEELKQILACDKEETYKEFKRFNDLILKKVYKEMHEKTECRYEYEPVKKGRSVIAVRFTVKSLAPEIERKLKMMEENGQIDFDTYLNGGTEIEEAWKAELSGEDFTEAQMDMIAELLYTVPDHKMPNMAYGLWANRTHYIAQKLAMMNVYAEKKPIKNRFNYLLSMIKADTE